jgi:ABC-type Zn uptake system ZnuABC Zn-binding protein ZnuA
MRTIYRLRIAHYASRLTLLFITFLLSNACQARGVNDPSASQAQSSPKILVAETYLADIVQNVAGDRLNVESLIPLGLDPHTFEPTPQDVARIAESEVLIINGAGFEEWLQEVLDNAGGERLVIEASAGLSMRVPREGEEAHTEDETPTDCPAPGQDQAQESECAPAPSHVGEEEHEGDPHFWLDPNQVIGYVANIRDGLSQADPEGEAIYARNAEAYTAELEELDAWIAGRVAEIPPDQRLLVTNHESFGYFADRYGFTIIGTVIPSVSTGASPSAQQLADLIDDIQATNAKAIFLETGANPDLAEQIATETGVKVVSGLFTHSVSAPDGIAPTYIDMMMYNTQTIVDALMSTQ